MPKKFLVICLNPVIQKTLVFERLELNQVNRAKIIRTDASGKGVNVARVLSQRGAEAVHLTQAGGLNREWFLSLCAADGLAVEWVDSGSEVRFCTTVIETSTHSATELVEEALPVSPGTEERLLERFDRLISGFDILVISGTKAAGYSDAVIPEMVKRASGRGLMTLLDIKGRDLVASLPFRPTVVKPNLSEFLATFPPSGTLSGGTLSGTSLVDTSLGNASFSGAAASPAVLRAHVQEYARGWKERYGTDLIVTRGAAPIWFSEDGRAAEEPILPVETLNPTGSGDSFTAGLAFALATGASLRNAIREGAKLGALNAATLKPGSILAQ
jgi:fructose-1-phosphate kinase PfkB-like protein